jgi:nucleotide-binding universal stress UspA family protein
VIPAIVCAVDDSRRARRVAAFAGRLAQAVDGRVVLAHVFDPLMVPAPRSREQQAAEDVEDHERRRAHRALVDVVDALGEVEHATEFAEGRPVEELLRLEREHDAFLVVIGSAARKPLERLMQGSTSAALAAGASCPTVVVTDAAALDLDGPLIAAYDGSDHALQAARHGAALAAALDRDLVLMHVTESGGPRVGADADLALELHEAARSCAASAGRTARPLDVTIVVEHGDPVEQLTRAAQERAASLVLVGSRGRTALTSALLGSVSAGLVRSADRPVVVVGPAAERDW